MQTDSIVSLPHEQASVQQESLLCQLPREVLWHITSYLTIRWNGEYFARWREINKFASVCKHLDETVTIPGKKLGIYMREKREGQSIDQLLSSILHLINRILKRGGNNPVLIRIDSRNLVQDMQALSKFSNAFPEGALASRLDEINSLGHNLYQLPDELVTLTSLRTLRVGENFLQQRDIELIAKIPSLTDLDISGDASTGHGLTMLPASIANLTLLKRLNVSRNYLTKDVFAVLKPLSNLEEVDFADNPYLTLTDIVRNYSAWPRLRMVQAAHLELGDEATFTEKLTRPDVMIGW